MIKYKYQGSGYADRLGKKCPYPEEFLVGLYRQMLRIRMVEVEIEREYHKDEMKTPVHLMIGQEATAVGAANAMKITDLLYCSHRTHGCYLAKGGDLKAMMSELYCKANGCVGSRGGSMHLIDKKVGMAGTSAIVGGIIPIATGSALAQQLKGEKNISCVFFGEAANEEGVTSESLNFAVLKKLPLIFFCENNYYSVCTPLDQRQPIVEMHKRAAGFGIKTFTCDGTNVLDVYETMQKAVEHARTGQGPVYIESPVYRFRAHAGAGDDSQRGYRDVAEREHWEKDHCPVKAYDAFLRSMKVLDDNKLRKMEEELAAEVKAAFVHAQTSPVPTEADVFKHAYALG